MSFLSGIFGTGNIVKMLFPAFAKIMKDNKSTVHIYPDGEEGVEITMSKNEDVDRLSNEIIGDNETYVMGKKNGKIFCRKAYTKKPEEGGFSEMKFYFKKEDLSPSLAHLYMEKGIRFFTPSIIVEDEDISNIMSNLETLEENENE